jgi:hypothetical protein
MNDDTIIEYWTREMNAYVDPKTHLLAGPLGEEETDLSSADGWLSAGYDTTLRCQVFAPDRYHCPAGARLNPPPPAPRRPSRNQFSYQAYESSSQMDPPRIAGT